MIKTFAMFDKVTFFSMILICVIVLSSSVYLFRYSRTSYGSSLEEQLERQVLRLRYIATEALRKQHQQTGQKSEMIIDLEIPYSIATVFDVEGSILGVSSNATAQMPVSSNTIELLSDMNSSTDVRIDTETFGGANHISALAPIIIDGEVVGAANVTRPLLNIDNHINQLLSVMVLVISLVSLLCFGVMYIIIRRSFQLRSEMSRATSMIKNCNWEYRMAPEISRRAPELGDAFKQMSKTIERRLGDAVSENHRLSLILDMIADGVIVTDDQGRVEFMNSAAEWMFDAPAREVVGRQLSNVIRDYEVLQLASDSSATGDTKQRELELFDQHRFLNAIATPRSTGSDKGVILTFQDVTRHWQVENTRKEFVSNVSHELRNPLAAIRAMTETLQEGALTNHHLAKDFLIRIQDDVQRMTIMVNELMELSRLESGQIPTHLIPVDLVSVVKEVETGFNIKFKDNVVLNIDISLDTPLVMAEHDKLIQILENLVENAVKFTGEKGCIWINAKTTSRTVQIIVKDNGVGISREHLPFIFERFYKVDRSRRSAGIGLGLAIVKHLVQAHDGDIKVESIQGEGSIFSFFLNRAS